MKEQKCPLCGEEFYSEYAGDDLIYCNNKDCFLSLKYIDFDDGQDAMLLKLNSQISRIKQEAKQEVFDSIDKMSNNELNGFCRFETYGTLKCDCEHCEYIEIKKKHGVE